MSAGTRTMVISSRVARAVLGGATAILLIASCGPVSIVDQTTRPEPNRTLFPTPATETLQVTGTTASGDRLRIIIPALALDFRPPDTPVQIFVALVDPQGTYSYLLYPANRRGESVDQFDLSDYPIEVGVSETTPYVALWAVAYHLSGTTAAETQGWDALATSLALSFRTWLNSGEPTDDPLAGAVCASDGSLYAWFAEMEVVGQAMAVIERTGKWDRDVSTMTAGDGSLSAVFDVDYLAAADSTPPVDSSQPTKDSLPAEPVTEPASGVQYTLVLEKTFDDPASGRRWYLSPTRAYSNDTSLLTLRDQTFSESGVAFFCAARSVPATCRLESLRVWQPPA